MLSYKSDKIHSGSIYRKLQVFNKKIKLKNIQVNGGLFCAHRHSIFFSVYPQIQYNCKQYLSKLLCCYRQTDSEVDWKTKGRKSQSNPGKEADNGMTLHDTKIYYKATVDKAFRPRERKKQMDQWSRRKCKRIRWSSTGTSAVHWRVWTVPSEGAGESGTHLWKERRRGNKEEQEEGELKEEKEEEEALSEWVRSRW